MQFSVPDDYTRISLGFAEVVARNDVAPGIREALALGSLYDHARTHAERRELVGRRAVFAIPLALGQQHVVVRRSQHGGALAFLTRDLFLAPTRAPNELLVSLRLVREGVQTPAIVAYVVYPVCPLFRRSDVATTEVPGEDLRSVLESAPHQALPEVWLAPVSELLNSLVRAGARHPDLNIKNILLGRDHTGTMQAHILDVDRVCFHRPEDPEVRSANFQRFTRSLRK